jgi:hypothetical protein
MLRIDERLKERVIKDYQNAQHLVALIVQLSPVINEQAIKTLPQAKESLKRARIALQEAEEFVSSSVLTFAAMVGHLKESQAEAEDFQHQLAHTATISSNLETYLRSDPGTTQRAIELADDDILVTALRALPAARLAILAMAIETVRQERVNFEAVQAGVETVSDWDGHND